MIARYELYRRNQRTNDGVEDDLIAVDSGRLSGGSGSRSAVRRRAPAGVVVATSGAALTAGGVIVTSTRPVTGCPSGPTRRHRTDTAPGCTAGSGVTTSVSPAAPCTEPASSLRAPDASIRVTVSVSSGTDLSNTHTIWVGATDNVAPSAGSLETSELCASTLPGDTPSTSRARRP